LHSSRSQLTRKKNL